MPSSSPESFRPLLLLSALLLGLGALTGRLADEHAAPLRTVGATGCIGGHRDVLLVNEEDDPASILSSGCLPTDAPVHVDKEYGFVVEPGTAVRVIDVSDPKLTQVRVLEGVHAGRTGWAQIENVIEAQEPELGKQWQRQSTE